jgi:hypothetical protein
LDFDTIYAALRENLGGMGRGPLFTLKKVNEPYWETLSPGERKAFGTEFSKRVRSGVIEDFVRVGMHPGSKALQYRKR